MNRFLLFLALSFTAGTIAIAQEYNTESSEVTKADLSLNSFPQDSTANAFYIYEEGYSQFEDGGDYNLLTNYVAKIKILNKDGYDHSVIKIRLGKNEDRKEKIHDLKAYTYHLQNDQIYSRRLEPSKIYTEENEHADYVSFTFPDVKPSSVLVYSYQKESPFYFDLETWWFQEDIPKLHSEFTTKLPTNYNYNIRIIGNLPLDKNESELIEKCSFKSILDEPGYCVLSEYEMNDIPAFIEEEYMTSKYNYISRLDFELKEYARLDGYVQKFTKAWEDVDKEIKDDKSIGKQLKRTSQVDDVLPEAIKAKPNNLEKAREIYRFVRDNYQWNGDYALFRDMNLKDVIRDKAGNISGINILLHNLLKEEGFDVLAVLGSTRNNGFLTKLYPILSEFNYLMVQLKQDDKEYLLDATDKFLDFGIIPFKALNQHARLMDFENGSSWITLEPSTYSSISFIDQLTLNPDGTAQGKSDQVYTGYQAVDARKFLEKERHNGSNSAIAISADYTSTLSTAYENEDEPSKKFRATKELKNTSQKINDQIYLNPFSYKFIEDNPFKLAERNYPIDFGYKKVFNYRVEIEIPENYSIVEIPKQKIISLPENGGRIQFLAEQTADNRVKVQFRVALLKSLYIAGFYPYLKEFYNTIIDIQNQSLLVIRENS
ncbi:hypothetical protein [Salegentibacter chungangensis]|uniref:DUF3857 domain-containing protein n=1 Tax=Salegentibacter chungangensis TaxID=1335724 RepID=A0ABW3NTR6_9FLAO